MNYKTYIYVLKRPFSIRYFIYLKAYGNNNDEVFNRTQLL